MSHRASHSYRTFNHSICMWHFLYITSHWLPLQCTTSRHIATVWKAVSLWEETSALLLLKQGCFSCIKLEADCRQFTEKCGRKVSHVSSFCSQIQSWKFHFKPGQSQEKKSKICLGFPTQLWNSSLYKAMLVQ